MHARHRTSGELDHPSTDTLPQCGESQPDSASPHLHTKVDIYAPTQHFRRGSTMLFETERLYCRRWVPQDFAPLFAIYSDAETIRWCGDGTPITHAECHEWFAVTEDNYSRRGYGMFAFVESNSHQVVGFGGLVHPGGQTVAEIKYAFERSRWGQGLATEVVPALLSYGASEHGLKRVIATVARENKASQRVLIKSGMSLDASRKEDDGSVTQIYRWHDSDVASQ